MLLRLSTLLLAFITTVIVVRCSHEVWPEITDDNQGNYPKPTSWKDKNYGQWCRNRTLGLHVQCQMGSVVHLYECCGVNGTECCFRLQPVIIAYGGGLGVVFAISLIFGLLLKFNIICPISEQHHDVEYQDIPKAL
uniref:CX domain-containing protein n=1 Tax=Syphacia muris TaxID=451379 RepID=A0A0N5AFC1_9BILA